jgi:hypothetical protein
MSARDVVLIGVVVFAFAIGFFILSFTTGQVFDSLKSVEAINSSDQAVAAWNGTETALARLDWAVFGIFIGMVLAILVTGFFVGGHPIFMFFYFILIVIGVILAAVLANVWENVSTASVFGTHVLQYNITNNLLLYLPYYIAVVGFLGVVIMFAKPKLVSKFE